MHKLKHVLNGHFHENYRLWRRAVLYMGEYVTLSDTGYNIEETRGEHVAETVASAQLLWVTVAC